jgi:hypothetical protein
MQMFTTPNPDFLDFNQDGDEVVAGYQTYADAQAAIDRLADAQFPVQYTEIVGRNLRLVERVTGRITDGRATAVGAATGAWFGLFIGLLVGLFTPGPAWLGLILGVLLIGVLWGALFGFLAHRMGSGRHDYESLRSLAASRYEVMVANAYADRARQLLSPLA